MGLADRQIFIGSVQFCSGDINQMKYPWIPEISLNACITLKNNSIFSETGLDCTNGQTSEFFS